MKPPRASFRQSHLIRAVKAARAAGVELEEVVLTPSGDIKLRIKGEWGEASSRPNDFDQEFG